MTRVFHRGPRMVMHHQRSTWARTTTTSIEAAHRPFVPALGASMLVVVVLAQVLRWWCITILGPRWNTRVIVIPRLPLVEAGPYRWMRHPNYAAVVAEGIALPLVHTGWITAACFTMANAALLRVRIASEN